MHYKEGGCRFRTSLPFGSVNLLLYLGDRGGNGRETPYSRFRASTPDARQRKATKQRTKASRTSASCSGGGWYGFCGVMYM